MSKRIYLFSTQLIAFVVLFFGQVPIEATIFGSTSNIAHAKRRPNFDPKSALKDPDKKISPQFHIPKALEERTAFWFDIYTKYGSNQHVIHHVRYPWIIYKVVDTSEINNNLSLHKWTRYHRSQKQVRDEVAKVRATIRKLSQRKYFNKLTADEKVILAALDRIKGKRTTIIREALHDVRTQLGQKDFFLSGLATSTKYLAQMEQTFKSAGLPIELSRIPFVDSSFNEAAESKVGASGIWQIMPRTGKAYLTVNDHIDERNSPLKASLAAAEILKDNYRILKDWSFAVTAYNHGAFGLQKTIKSVRAKNLPDLIERYHAGSFKFASSNFFTCFLAALHAQMYYQKIFSKDGVIESEPVVPVVLALEAPTRAHRLEKLSTLSKEELLFYNPDLKAAFKNNALIPKGFKLLVPAEVEKSVKNRFREASLTLKGKSRS